MPFQQVITLHSMQLTNRPAPPTVGPSGFCDHKTAGLATIKESIVKHRISQYWPLFWGVFLSVENIPWGSSNAWDHPCAISQTFPPASKQCKNVTAEVCKVGKKTMKLVICPKIQNLVLRVRWHSLFCQHNVNWKALCRNKENAMLHTFSNKKNKCKRKKEFQ